MTVRGRLRFEILRRDNHTCRYCGASAPDARLTVDHVIPVSLGGTDDPSNLVAACVSCNGGKASIAPDSELVADVRSDSMALARALEFVIEERSAKRATMREYIEQFDEAWLNWRTRGGEGDPIERSADWAGTLERWISLGVDIDELIEMIPRAMAKPSGDAWRYFCGIGWNILTQIQDEARSRVADDSHAERTHSSWECNTCGGTVPPSDCEQCLWDLYQAHSDFPDELDPKDLIDNEGSG